MKTDYVVYKLLGSETHTDSLRSAEVTFNNCLESTALFSNCRLLKCRRHVLVGYIYTGIKFIGNIKIYKCSDNNKLITCVGEDYQHCFDRISKIDEQRVGKTYFFEVL